MFIILPAIQYRAFGFGYNSYVNYTYINANIFINMKNTHYVKKENNPVLTLPSMGWELQYQRQQESSA